MASPGATHFATVGRIPDCAAPVLGATRCLDAEVAGNPSASTPVLTGDHLSRDAHRPAGG